MATDQKKTKEELDSSSNNTEGLHMPYPGLKHMYQKCTGRKNKCDGCNNRDGRDCLYDTLSICNICGAGEGELLEFCPGVLLTVEAREDCYSTGRVIDLQHWYHKHERGMTK